jgi:hypothetical protein
LAGGLFAHPAIDAAPIGGAGGAGAAAMIGTVW